MWWLPTTVLLLVGFGVYVASALHVLSFSPLRADRLGEGRADAVREVPALQASEQAERVAATIRLSVGEPPAVVQHDVPLPFGIRASGTRPTDEGAARSRDRAVFVTPGALADVLTFYRSELARRDWHEVRTWMSRPPDGAAGPGMVVSAFCRGLDQPSLLVAVVSPEPGASELRLLLDADADGPCASSGRSSPWYDRPPPVF